MAITNRSNLLTDNLPTEARSTLYYEISIKAEL